jgi:putative glutamine amidotransferase
MIVMKKTLILLVGLLMAGFSYAQKKPIIGLSSNWIDNSYTSAYVTYVRSVMKTGGVPVVLPVTSDESMIGQYLDIIDGLIMTGGEDIDPSYFGEEPIKGMGRIVPERDEFDIKLIKMAVARNIPVLGICRGEQLLNVAFGGTLYQDIPSQIGEIGLKHNQNAPNYHASHGIEIEKGSFMEVLLGTTFIRVNSLHHQAVKDIAPGFIATAKSKDGIIEAIEMIGSKRVLGVQFHPECFIDAGYPGFTNIFTHFINEASKNQKIQ